MIQYNEPKQPILSLLKISCTKSTPVPPAYTQKQNSPNFCVYPKPLPGLSLSSTAFTLANAS